MKEFDPETPPVPEPRANHGHWQSHADRYLEERDHLVRVAGITLSQIQKLNSAGIMTMTRLAKSGKHLVPRLSCEIQERLAQQAELQIRTCQERKTAPNDK